MGGKGQRRREKNYLAAHSSAGRLPPPPNPKELEAIPSKLRKLMLFKNPPPSASGSNPLDAPPEKKKAKTIAAAEMELKKRDSITTSSLQMSGKGATADASLDEKSKGKRKRKAVSDLWFLNEVATLSKKKDRKKEFLQARKKKHKKANTNVVDFPAREEIIFGDVVQAPPKLSFPKLLKASMDASWERFRLEAIEAYRSQRKWVSRPGMKLPSLAEVP